MNLTEWMQEGGMMMWVILALVLPVAGTSSLHAAMAKRLSLALAGGALGLVVAVGALGTWLGRRATEEALAGVGPGAQEALRAQGYLEASRPLYLAAIVAAIGLVPFAVGEARRLRRKS